MAKIKGREMQTQGQHTMCYRRGNRSILHMSANFGGLPVASHSRVQLRVFVFLHNLEHFFTLSHSLPLHDSHLNTGLLIAKIQANLARNKGNKMVDKTQPYNLPL